MRSIFFIASDLPENTFSYDVQTYRVLTGHGVLMRENKSYKYIATDGLRSCVAFGLINPHDSTVLLVHFYNLAQVKNDLKMMCDTFLEETNLENHGAICIIAGGRDYCDSSLGMIDYIYDIMSQNTYQLR